MPTGIYNHKPHKKETKEKIRKAHTGRRHNWNNKDSWKVKYANGYINPMKGKNRPDVIKRNKQRNQTGENNGNWKGGIVETSNGYIWVHCPKHPFVESNGYVLQHRLIMEEHLGRLLSPTEVVHHINENKSDNRIENLQLLNSLGDHNKIHKKTDEKI